MENTDKKVTEQEQNLAISDYIVWDNVLLRRIHRKTAERLRTNDAYLVIARINNTDEGVRIGAYKTLAEAKHRATIMVSDMDLSDIDIEILSGRLTITWRREFLTFIDEECDGEFVFPTASDGTAISPYLTQCVVELLDLKCGGVEVGEPFVELGGYLIKPDGGILKLPSLGYVESYISEKICENDICVADVDWSDCDKWLVN